MSENSLTPLVVGIDNASKTGIVIYEPTTKKLLRQVLVEVDKNKPIPEQLSYIYDVIQKIIIPYTNTHRVYVFTEAPYLHITGNNLGRQQMFITTFGRLKGIEAVIQTACQKAGVSIQSVPIRSHQAFTKRLLGVKVSGRDDTKAAFQAGFTKLFGAEFQSNDVSDAISIALYGASLIEGSK